MMLDWEGYRQDLLGRIGELGRLTPQTVRGYRELSDAGNKTAHLDAKTRELIAIAVGVTRQCDGCITTHVHAAKKQSELQMRILLGTLRRRRSSRWPLRQSRDGRRTIRRVACHRQSRPVPHPS